MRGARPHGVLRRWRRRHPHNTAWPHTVAPPHTVCVSRCRPLPRSPPTRPQPAARRHVIRRQPARTDRQLLQSVLQRSDVKTTGDSHRTGTRGHGNDDRGGGVGGGSSGSGGGDDDDDGGGGGSVSGSGSGRTATQCSGTRTPVQVIRSP